MVTIGGAPHRSQVLSDCSRGGESDDIRYLAGGGVPQRGVSNNRHQGPPHVEWRIFEVLPRSRGVKEKYFVDL